MGTAAARTAGWASSARKAPRSPRRRQPPKAGRCPAGPRTGRSIWSSSKRCLTCSYVGLVKVPFSPPSISTRPSTSSVAGPAAEVPGRVGDRGRGAERVTAENHLARAPGASRQDHAPQVAQGEVEAPLAREREVLSPERLKPPAVDRLEPQVVVEGLVGVAPGEHRGVLQRVGAAVNGPNLKVGHPRDDVAGDQPEVPGAADEARHEHQHAARLGRPDLVDEDAVEALGPRATRALDRDVALGDRRRRDCPGPCCAARQRERHQPGAPATQRVSAARVPLIPEARRGAPCGLTSTIRLSAASYSSYAATGSRRRLAGRRRAGRSAGSTRSRRNWPV